MTRIESPRPSVPSSPPAPTLEAAVAGRRTARSAEPRVEEPQDRFSQAASGTAPRRTSDAVEDLVAIRGARAAAKKLKVDEALIQKYSAYASEKHLGHPDHRHDLQLAMAEAQVAPAQLKAILDHGETGLRSFVAGLRGKSFADEAALQARVDAEIERTKFRELNDPLHMAFGRDRVNNVSEMALPKAQVELLRAHGLRTNQDVLQRTRTPEDRAALQKELGLSKQDMQRLVTHADLTRLGDIGGFYADALRRIGIDSVPELANRNPESLRRELAKSLEARGQQKYVPGLDRCQEWVHHAKFLPRIVETYDSLSQRRAEIAALTYWEAQSGGPVSYYASREGWQKAMTQGGASIPGAWMWRQKQDSRSVSFQCGRDDLNHVDVRADRKTGEVTVTAEH